MGIILYIGENKDITDNISKFALKNFKVSILNRNNYYKHFIEEYMPDYIILSAETHNFNDISKYIADKPGIQLIITDNNKAGSRQFDTALQLGEEPSTGQLRDILNIIDKLYIEKSDNNSNCRFVKQEVISFYSVQGGVGKTSIAFNTAWYLGKKDIGKILLIDLNFCEGPSDISINLGRERLKNMGTYIKNTLDGCDNIHDSITSLNNIDIMVPPQSLHQSDRFDLDMLNNLIYSARNEYDVIISDIPFRYDNISLEMLNLSTCSIIVLSPEIRFASRVVDFKKFLPDKQKKAAVLNKTNSIHGQIKKDYENIIGMPVYGQFETIPGNNKKMLMSGRSVTRFPDMQSGIEEFVDHIF